MRISYITPQLLSFKQNIDFKKAEKNLIEYEKNDFISGIYYTDLLNKERITMSAFKINKYLSDNKLQDYNSPLFESNPNDTAFKLAAIAKKLTLSQKDTIIKNSTPDIFKDINSDSLVKDLDTLSFLVRDNLKEFCEPDTYIKLGNKHVNIDYIGKGENSIVMKLDDGKNPPVVMKTFIRPEEIHSLSLWGEMAIYQELKNANINNIPKLYFANPISTKVEDKSKEYTEAFDVDELRDFDNYKGGWSIVEYITKDTPLKNGGISLQDWLNNHNLYHLDLSCDNCIGKYVTDLGGICG